MTVPDLVRLILAALFLGAGLFIIAMAILGVFKFKFVMNRMHCAALIDAIALALILIGLGFASGNPAFFPKLALILIFQWIGSPIASHMVGRLEVDTDDELSGHMKRLEARPANEDMKAGASASAEKLPAEKGEKPWI